MKVFRRSVLLLLPALLGVSGGCDSRPEGWTPVLEETSTVFLETETARLLEHVQSARDRLATDPAGAEAALEEAQSTLEELRDYYLPLFQARERAYNAYRSLYLADETRVFEELDEIEGILGAMAELAQGGRLNEIQTLGEALSDARLAVEAGPSEGAPALETLARKLNQAALKGDLILRK
ncbi:MAG: hypothetical protein ACWGSQ_00560 [Longimicrobiales bacterium]